MAVEYWFYFDLHSKGSLVGRSKTFEIHGQTNRTDAKLAAEEAWLATGALRGEAFVLFRDIERAALDSYTLREHEDSPARKIETPGSP